jgi:hypothetical protein
VILVFLSPPEPPETCTLTLPRTTMLAMVVTPWHYPSFCIVLVQQPNLCHLKFYFGCVIGNSVMISDHDETGSLLWCVTQGCASQHELVSRLLVMIHCRTTLMCYLLVGFFLSYLSVSLWRSIYQTRYGRTSFWHWKEDNLWRIGHRHKYYRLQEVVDKCSLVAMKAMSHESLGILEMSLSWIPPKVTLLCGSEWRKFFRPE